ncbi:hypothetical protein KP509_29G037200 [Ceratopteris richardii]|nr:hypothetical protein KP509_29G037200 [Ceratopteris richardii]
MVDEDLGMQTNKLYDVALPEGETLDYPPVNPLHSSAPSLEPLSNYPHILITISDKDFRYDMTMEFYQRVNSFCSHVQLFVTADKGHVFHLFDPLSPQAETLMLQLASFIQACTTR